ncbi:hypothetical protein GCM10009133_23960 [Cocleimonas flava]|jgi:LysM repeat protein|uniref:LysM domain-containing protein n=1 Tax=Cocleimonas flava TaxID=634765 RepID=A0A4R1ER52_9GAMM|nr:MULTISPECIES: LysM domain-containing protein [Cocleimonas]MEB8432497.1 LysM domain-containing protein [Cocleimonas sp. KMM 6892]MEC4715356.1 LysM domain-containing protein [Cocleimonas sp. KMM 6895]MEC4745025.1 LysM domain-containing protein [Cocleimonas sp. KMM 6896]TCJ82930.1 LysM domain-containing protein [Cocleimonas flava]
MDSKIKLVAVASLVAVMASGCSSYRGASQAGYDTGATSSGGYSTSGETRGYGQRTRANQVAGGGQVRGGGQQRANTSATCAPCGATATQPKAPATYTYKPAKPAAPVAQPRTQTSTHNQQYYIDKWNREQAAARNKVQQPAAQPQQNTNYAGYGTNSNTQYYDYSSASGGQTTAPAANTNVTASNKSIYTGSYQQKTYKPYAPTTYSGGSAATTNTATYANTAGTSSSGGSSYVVKKGDTVFEIMRQTGVYWKDIISINNLQPPYNISPGQTIRLK